MNFGFALKRLALTGAGKEVAEVTFKRGLNIIAGPSDSGKSLVTRFVDYALGAGTPPQSIPEAEGYTSVVLEIEANRDRRVYTLERSLQGGAVVCRTAGLQDRILAEKHDGGNEDTVSQFLLSMSGLGTKRLRTDGHGKTRTLSFRDIAPLIIVGETSVMDETSPILSGEVNFKTEEEGVFRLLLTGTDDSSIVATEHPKVAKGRQAGRVELLGSLLATARQRLGELGDVGSLKAERARLAHAEASIQVAIAERTTAQAGIAPLETKRTQTWLALRSVESKLAVLIELQARFALLHEQYASDLRRLETIAEASVRLGQLAEQRCPVCGALAESHDHAQADASIRTTPTQVASACRAEGSKTERLLRDLQKTRVATAAEIEDLQNARAGHQNDLASISQQLKALMAKHVDTAARRVDELRSSAETCRRAIELLERIGELQELLEDSKKRRKKEKTKFADSALSSAQADPFSREVEALLRAWHLPNLDRVTFSDKEQDVVVSGRSRRTHGKGVRAILHTAFNLALLRLCVNDERPFPNFVVIDSPLIVYEEPDADESSFPVGLKTHFWNSVNSCFADAQVIIIENHKQLPSDDQLRIPNTVIFTGAAHGRRGFIPSPT
jgi:hypothetical protein